MQKNRLFEAPPYAIESTLKVLGSNIRTARLRRNLSIQDLSQRIGCGSRAIMDAEKGKITTAIGVYCALLWALDLLEQLTPVADPNFDRVGVHLSLTKERARIKRGQANNDDF
jgi:transcriptional regulator with XRE-family HTH domain